MVDFQYAKGRIEESVDFISKEMEEFEKDYAAKDWQEYKENNKLQKLIDRTVENILTALIEISGTIVVEEGISGRSYAEILVKVGQLFGFTDKEQEELSRLAVQRNRLAHRYLNYRWEATRSYKKAAPLIRRLLVAAIEREKKNLA
jgi:uncharacterized protein YutE (UPF0331/DUF86 family)